jgi:RNA polymerase sigma factor (sigma-70 family)
MLAAVQQHVAERVPNLRGERRTWRWYPPAFRASRHPAPSCYPPRVTTAAETSLDEAIALVRACADGDAGARRDFQDRFAVDIYNFPVKIYGVSPEQAADFYVYVFERDRVFMRLRTFEGRGGAQLRTFLAFQVLRGLFLDWQRTHRELETVSLSDPLRGSEGERVLEDVVAAPGEDEVAPDPAPDEAGGDLTELWASLSPEERLDLKLLSLLEHELAPAELRLLADLSKRSVEETAGRVAKVQTALRRKDERIAELAAEVDSVWGWLVLRRRELQETREKIRRLSPGDDSRERTRLDERARELEAAVEKRMRQHERLLEEVRSFKVTTPYKDIAQLKGSTVGTVCSRIFRLRQRLQDRFGDEGGAR